MSVFNGSPDNDSFAGGSGSDTFNLADGGDDTATGGSGSDTFNLGAALSAGDQLDGGAGLDILYLDGDYSAGLVLDADTITGFEQLNLAAGHSYSLTLANGNIGASGMTITGGAFDDSIAIDNSAASATAHLSVAVQGDLTFTGGNAAEALRIAAGVLHATASLGAGADSVTLAGAFLSGYSFTADPETELGQAIFIIGASAGRLNLTGAKLSGFNALYFTGNAPYQVKIANDVVTSGQPLQVSIGGDATGSIIDAGKVHDGRLTFFSAENCTLIGGRGDDAFHLNQGFEVGIGGGGSDYFDIVGGGGAIVYSRLADTTKAHFDTIYLLGTITIDLSAIDADTTQAGNQAFTLVSEFDHHAGEVCVVYKSKTNVTNILMDADGDGKPDAMIQMYDDHRDFHDFVL